MSEEESSIPPAEPQERSFEIESEINEWRNETSDKCRSQIEVHRRLTRVKTADEQQVSEQENRGTDQGLKRGTLALMLRLALLARVIKSIEQCCLSHCGKQYGDFSKNWKKNYHMTMQLHSWVLIKKKKITLKNIHAPQCSQQRYLQLQRYGSNLSIHQQMDR